jgi:S-adenosylmethionine-dependent methyltransferase
VSDDIWASLVGQFADGAYASVKGYVRTYVMHQHLLAHLPPPPAPVLDVGGGAGHQSFPLARRDPYRQLSRVFHLVGRKGPA